MALRQYLPEQSSIMIDQRTREIKRAMSAAYGQGYRSEVLEAYHKILERVPLDERLDTGILFTDIRREFLPMFKVSLHASRTARSIS